MSTVLYNPITVNPLAYLVFPGLYELIPNTTDYIEYCTYTGILEIHIGNLLVKLYEHTNSIDLSEFVNALIRISLVTELGSVLLGEWIIDLLGVAIPEDIRKSMVVWYDVAKQNATNESMRANPILKDFSGNGHDATCYNFAWAGKSGIGGYGERDFNESRKSSDVGQTTTLFEKTNNSIHLIAQTENTSVHPVIIRFYGISSNEYSSEWRIKITGLKENQGIRPHLHNNIMLPASVLDDNGSVDDGGNILSDGTYLLKPVLNTNRYPSEVHFMSYPGYREQEYDITVELLPQYPNALVSDGVDDYAMVKGLPMLNKEDGYTVIVKRTYIDNNLNQYTLIAKNSTNNNTDGAFKFEQLTEGYKCSTDSFGISTRLDFSSNNIVYQQTRSYNGEKSLNAGRFEDSNFMVIFNDGGYQPKLHACTALYSLILFNRDLTPEEIAWVKTNLIS